MTPRPPFTIIPWRTAFLPGLLELALEETDGDIGRASFIFPHSRPIRYCTLLLHRSKAVRKPLLLPRMHTVSSLFSLLAGRVRERPAWTAGLLDRVGLLLQCVREAGAGERDAVGGEEDDGRFTSGAGLAETPGRGYRGLADPKRFFPWGVRLASLYEECFGQCRRPHDFIHIDGRVSPYARALLERLGAIFSRYEAGLAGRDWTTPGHDAFRTASYIKSADALPPGAPFSGGPVYIAGFHALTGAEDALFRHLWERGGRVVLHADPDIVEGRGHWSCRALADWARSWNARMDMRQSGVAAGEDDLPGAPAIRYIAGYDLHSQLAALQEELAVPAASPGPLPYGAGDGAGPETGPGINDDPAVILVAEQSPATPREDRLADTAVILPDSGLLLPVLHHLPRTDINISMGYPLARSPLFRLTDILLRLQERRRGRGYYWRDLVELLRHPYIKMLREEEEAPEPAGESTPGPEKDRDAASGDAAQGLRRELHVLERALRQQGGKYIDPRAFLLDEYSKREQEAMPAAGVLGFLEKLLATALDAFAEPRTPGELAACLEGICDLLLSHGGHLWRHFPIDAECMYRMRRSLIPELARSALADEALERETLFALLRSLMEAERVPFEADPLVGMQVMGMLESRLLSFRRVIVADAVEASLPGSGRGDPLLPDALRPELGLPSLHGREQVAAYHFFRLVQSAGEVVLLWREGVPASGIAEGNDGKSRFIEELLWEEEKRKGSLFVPGRDEPPLRVIPARVSPIAAKRRALPVTAQIRRLMLAVLAAPVSASLLDAYLACPLRFFYERAAGLAPADEVGEGDDPLAVGNMMHLLLHDVYKDLLGRRLPGDEALEGLLGGELEAAFSLSPELARLGRALPADSFAMLAAAGRQRLADYLRAQPPTTPLALERGFTADFSVPARTGPAFTVRLTGKADRIDLRESPPLPEPEAHKPHLVILDYKTGRVPRLDRGLWERDALWNALDAWTPDAVRLLPAGTGAVDPVFSDLAERLESVQLPFYLLLHHLAAKGSAPLAGEAAALDARWVGLGDKGREEPLFPEAMPHEKRWEIITDTFPRLVTFLLRHMAETRILLPRPGVRCGWCSSAKLCMVSSAPATPSGGFP